MRKGLNALRCGAIGIAAIGFAPAALAQQAAAPAAQTAAAPATNSLIAGFRGAKFGMTEAQVRAAIVTDLGVTADKIKSDTNVQERTTILQVTAPTLEPGPGPATVTYIFGAATKKLIKVSVVWALQTPNDQQRGALVTSGMQLADYFRAQPWQPNQARAGIPLGPNALSLFAGVDGRSQAVEVVVAGISYSREEGGKQVPSPVPTGPAVLQITYTANAANPDIYRIKPGSF